MFERGGEYKTAELGGQVPTGTGEAENLYKTDKGGCERSDKVVSPVISSIQTADGETYAFSVSALLRPSGSCIWKLWMASGRQRDLQDMIDDCRQNYSRPNKMAKAGYTRPLQIAATKPNE